MAEEVKEAAAAAAVATAAKKPARKAAAKKPDGDVAALRAELAAARAALAAAGGAAAAAAPVEYEMTDHDSHVAHERGYAEGRIIEPGEQVPANIAVADEWMKPGKAKEVEAE